MHKLRSFTKAHSPAEKNNTEMSSNIQKLKYCNRLSVEIKPKKKFPKVFCVRPDSINSKNWKSVTNTYQSYQDPNISQTGQNSIIAKNANFSIPESEFEDDDSEINPKIGKSLEITHVKLDNLHKSYLN